MCACTCRHRHWHRHRRRYSRTRWPNFTYCGCPQSSACSCAHGAIKGRTPTQPPNSEARRGGIAANMSLAAQVAHEASELAAQAGESPAQRRACSATTSAGESRLWRGSGVMGHWHRLGPGSRSVIDCPGAKCPSLAFEHELCRAAPLRLRRSRHRVSVLLRSSSVAGVGCSSSLVAGSHGGASVLAALACIRADDAFVLGRRRLLSAARSRSFVERRCGEALWARVGGALTAAAGVAWRRRAHTHMHTCAVPAVRWSRARLSAGEADARRVAAAHWDGNMEADPTAGPGGSRGGGCAPRITQPDSGTLRALARGSLRRRRRRDRGIEVFSARSSGSGPSVGGRLVPPRRFVHPRGPRPAPVPGPGG